MACQRSERRRRRRVDAAASQSHNSALKKKEQVRRDVRMAEKTRAGSLPYSPTVMSWLSRKLDKRASKITSDDVKTLLA